MANPNTTVLDGITFDQSQLGWLASALAQRVASVSSCTQTSLYIS